MSCSMDCFDCKNELNLCKLCVKKAKIKCLCADEIISQDICSKSIETTNLVAEQETANNVCISQNLQASNASVINLNTNSLCSQNGTINTLCVNDLTVGSINHCAKWRAAVTLSANTNYTLGTNLNWDVLLDDPNNNVTLSPFSYSVPISGYYVLTYNLKSDSLTGSGVITGVPVGLLTITVNGNELITFQNSYLSFAAIQDANLSSLLLLNAGDIIKMKYDVLILDPVSGLISYSGSVSLKGNGLLPGESFFDIHYLSSLNCTPITCQPCSPVQIPCTPVTIDCEGDSCCNDDNIGQSHVKKDDVKQTTIKVI